MSDLLAGRATLDESLRGVCFPGERGVLHIYIRIITS